MRESRACSPPSAVSAALHAALGAPGSGAAPVARRVLAAGADPRARDAEGRTPLMIASSDENSELGRVACVLERLKATRAAAAVADPRDDLDAAQRPTRAARGGGALAATAGDARARHAAERAAWRAGARALHFAAMRGDGAVALLLLEAGANDDARNRRGLNAMQLSHACGPYAAFEVAQRKKRLRAIQAEVDKQYAAKEAEGVQQARAFVASARVAPHAAHAADRALKASQASVRGAVPLVPELALAAPNQLKAAWS